jgi:hypothetical protein
MHRGQLQNVSASIDNNSDMTLLQRGYLGGVGAPPPSQSRIYDNRTDQQDISYMIRSRLKRFFLMAIINSDYTDILQIIIECSDPDTKMWGHTESAPLLTATKMNQLMVGGSTGTKRQVIYANILDRINVIAAIVASGKTITIKKTGKEVVSSDDGVEFNNYLSELRRNFSSLYADVVNVEPIRYGILSEMSPYASRTRTKRGQIKDENVKAISEEIYEHVMKPKMIYWVLKKTHYR